MGLAMPWMGRYGSKFITRSGLEGDGSVDLLTWCSYSINQLPSDEERKMMDEWVKILVAFVGANPNFDFGTKKIDDLKVLTNTMGIRVERDDRYKELRDLGAIFSQK